MNTPPSPLPADNIFKVPPAPFPIAQLDEATLLTAVGLRYSPNIRVATIATDRTIVKNEPSRTYLTLTPGQWRALKAFGPGPGRTVPQVLFQLISDRDCVPLREFYETVLKAFQAGVLHCDAATPPANDPPTPWKWRIAGQWVRWIALLSTIGTLFLTLRQPTPLPQHIGHLLAAWAVVCVAISAGAWCAAGVVVHANAEIYQPKRHYRTLFPRFSADLADAVMAGQPTVISAALANLTPSLLAVGLAAALAPSLIVPLLFAVVFLICPLWDSPGLKILHALWSLPTLDSDRNFSFQPNRALQHVLKTRLKKTDLRFLSIHILLIFIWLGLILTTAVWLLGANATALWEAVISTRGLHFTALTLIVGLSLVVAGALGTIACLGYIIVRDWWREKRRHTLVPQRASANPESIKELIDAALLFKSLPNENRIALAGSAEILQYPKGANIVNEGEPGEKLFLIFSGHNEVTRELPSGRQEAVAKLAAGDVFGEVALLHGTARTRSVRSLGPSVLLAFSRSTFNQLVLTKINRECIEETVQKIAFLERISLSRNWPPHAVNAFARRAIFQTFAEGSLLTQENEDNQFFFLVHEGELSVRRQKQDIAVLRIGDFFGEISLLQNSVATADIIARTPSRCLIMNKRDFLQFLTKDFTVSIFFEKISSKRLGYPIFPLKGKSLDLLRA